MSQKMLPPKNRVSTAPKKAPALLKKSDKYRIAARWSEKLAKGGFVPVVQDFLDHYHALKPYPLTHSEAMFVIHLIRYKWDESAPYPGYKAIATQMGVSTKSARRYARDLEGKGYLRRHMRVGETNRFDVKALIAALERHVAAVAEAKAAAESKRRQKTAGTGELEYGQ